MAIFTHFLHQIVHIFRPQGPQPNPDLEAGVVHDHIRDWSNIMITFVLAFAPAIPLTYAQIDSTFSPTFHVLSFELLLSFTLFFLSKFMKSKFPEVARGLDIAGVVFAVTALFTAITIPFPLYLQIITWVVYAFSIVAVSISVL
jgi:hypothetical protein